MIPSSSLRALLVSFAALVAAPVLVTAGDTHHQVRAKGEGIFQTGNPIQFLQPDDLILVVADVSGGGLFQGQLSSLIRVGFSYLDDAQTVISFGGLLHVTDRHANGAVWVDGGIDTLSGEVFGTFDLAVEAGTGRLEGVDGVLEFHGEVDAEGGLVLDAIEGTLTRDR